MINSVQLLSAQRECYGRLLSSRFVISAALVKDRANDSIACLLAANRVYQLIHCCAP